MDRHEFLNWLAANRGVVSTQQLASALDVDVRTVHRLGFELGVRVIGSSFAWTKRDALALYDLFFEEVVEAGDEEDDADDTEDEEDDADDTDDADEDADDLDDADGEELEEEPADDVEDEGDDTEDPDDVDDL